MYNPFSGWRITGSWANHMSYSLGGIDYPLPYNTPLRAPASGTLRTSGGRGEFAAGQVGSAGRRSILELDRPVLNLVAIVFQHQASFGAARHYDEGETLGLSGASANGNDWGGDVHLHTHGLLASGARVDWLGYLPFADPAPTSSVASGTKLAPPTPPNPARRNGDEMEIKYYRKEDGDIGRFGSGVKVFGSRADYTKHRESVEAYAKLNPKQAVVVPPNENFAGNFVTLDRAHWDIEAAVHGGFF